MTGRTNATLILVAAVFLTGIAFAGLIARFTAQDDDAPSTTIIGTTTLIETDGHTVGLVPPVSTTYEEP